MYLTQTYTKNVCVSGRDVSGSTERDEQHLVPGAFVRRWSSFQGSAARKHFGRALGKLSATPEITCRPASATLPEESDPINRQRASSFSIVLARPPAPGKKQNNVVITTSDNVTSDGQLDVALRKISSRFNNFIRVTSPISAENTSPLGVAKIDFDSLTSELITHCVISVRSGWMVRRCSKHSDKQRLFFELLSDLSDRDAADLVEHCPATTALVQKVCSFFRKVKVREHEGSAQVENSDLVCIGFGLTLLSAKIF